VVAVLTKDKLLSWHSWTG